jgi:hypothetical protein
MLVVNGCFAEYDALATPGVGNQELQSNRASQRVSHNVGFLNLHVVEQAAHVSTISMPYAAGSCGLSLWPCPRQSMAITR